MAYLAEIMNIFEDPVKQNNLRLGWCKRKLSTGAVQRQTHLSHSRSWSLRKPWYNASYNDRTLKRYTRVWRPAYHELRAHMKEKLNKPLRVIYEILTKSAFFSMRSAIINFLSWWLYKTKSIRAIWIDNAVYVWNASGENAVYVWNSATLTRA